VTVRPLPVFRTQTGRIAHLAAVLVLLGSMPASAQPWQSLFDGKRLAPWKKINFGGEGDVEIENGQLILYEGQSMTGVRYTGRFPKLDYEIRLEAKRLAGTDFFCGLTFPVGDSHCSFILGGWGGALVGLSSLDGRDASENETGQVIGLKDRVWYQVRVRVTDSAIRVWLDGKPIIEADIRGRKVSTRVEVDLCKPLGISSWETRAAIRNIEYRRLPPPFPPPNPPQVAPASQEARLSTGRMRLAKGLRASLFAAEPDVANIVAFDVDDRGRVFVCETFRQQRGVEDNRNHMDWLDDDLASMKVEDRLAYLKKHLGEHLIDYTRADDRIRLVVDTDGDGRADRATIFADRFNGPLDGTGAGVLSWGRDVFYTCIPHLWKLIDDDGDGRVDQRRRLYSGFGVRFAFRGHDLHGLTRGPDGRLYFSIGDRGYHVVTPQGIIADPESGAVFRCERDGSNLEVVATGLRNPQELAFDDYGNLFTGDNNSDSGDRARVVYVLPGMDAGWRMAYQYLPDRGPFNREKIWHPFHPSQPAFIVPPVANFADGPSGLTYYPGTGWRDSYRGTFFLCDFRGVADQSGIRAFRVVPEGAFFELVDSGKPVWKVLATDLQFGPDGALYVSDWVHGWLGENKGRIYRIVEESAAGDPRVAQVQRLLYSGMSDRTPEELAELLAHDDRRVRLRAQWELAERPSRECLSLLIDAAERGPNLLARLHGLWGWGQVIRRTADPSTLERAVALLDDSEAEVRAHACELLGEASYAKAWNALAGRLEDPAPRVRLYAALALAHFRRAEVAGPTMRMLADADDRDPALRHAGVMALASIGDDAALWNAFERQPESIRGSAAVRRAVVVALRRLRSPRLSALLSDPEMTVMEEAARAIHDVPVLKCYPALASLLESPAAAKSESVLRRALNANFRLGDSESADRLARFATKSQAPLEMRRSALKLLQTWTDPPPRDWVLGMWRPLPPRDPRAAQASVARVLDSLLAESSPVRWEALQCAAELRLKQAADVVEPLAADRRLSEDRRAEALRMLTRLDPDRAHGVADTLLNAPSIAVRFAALECLAAHSPRRAATVLRRQLTSNRPGVLRASFTVLQKLPPEQSAPLLVGAIERLIRGDLPGACQVELLEAARANSQGDVQAALRRYEASLPADDRLARYRPALAGGSVQAGRRIFRQRTDVSCQRCHTIAGSGGAVGPDLSAIGKEKTREYLLESIVDPNRQIAKGFDSVVVLDRDGKVHSGVLKREIDDRLELMTAEGILITIRKDEIEARKVGQSAMPDDLVKLLSLRDLRDLIAFLSAQKSEPQQK